MEYQVVCAEPVTGSSSTPVQEKNISKQNHNHCPSAETIKPRAESCFNSQN